MAGKSGHEKRLKGIAYNTGLYIGQNPVESGLLRLRVGRIRKFRLSGCFADGSGLI
jgi:hypothetical protein